jgi:hypothetical protein
MLPKRAKQSAKTTEESEDEMASRLHLDIGKDRPTAAPWLSWLTLQIERVRLSHDRANESNKSKAVDNFRSVTFDNWLRLFMQVKALHISTMRGPKSFIVRISSHETRRIRARG